MGLEEGRRQNLQYAHQENAGFLASWEEVEGEGDVVFPVAQVIRTDSLMSFFSMFFLFYLTTKRV